MAGYCTTHGSIGTSLWQAVCLCARWVQRRRQVGAAPGGCSVALAQGMGLLWPCARRRSRHPLPLWLAGTSTGIRPATRCWPRSRSTLWVNCDSPPPSIPPDPKKNICRQTAGWHTSLCACRGPSSAYRCWPSTYSATCPRRGSTPTSRHRCDTQVRPAAGLHSEGLPSLLLHMQRAVHRRIIQLMLRGGPTDGCEYLLRPASLLFTLRPTACPASASPCLPTLSRTN